MTQGCLSNQHVDGMYLMTGYYTRLCLKTKINISSIIDIINFKLHCHWDLLIKKSVRLLAGEDMLNNTVLETKTSEVIQGQFLRLAHVNVNACFKIFIIHQ